MKKFKHFLLLSVTTIAITSFLNISTVLATEETPDYILGRPMTEEEIEKQKSYEPKTFTKLHLSEVPESYKTYGKHGAYYPATYDSRDYNLITPVKYQANSNWCWAYSGASVLETAMIKAGISNVNNTDLSEASLAYYMYHRNDNGLRDPLGLMVGDYNTHGDATYYDGDFTQYSGNTQLLARFLATNMGVKNESYYTREQAENGSLPDLTKAYTEQSCVLKNAIFPANDKDSIKSAIQTYGSVCVAINWDDSWDFDSYDYSYYNYDTAAYCYPNSDNGTNHEVTLIGWDDNYSSINFASGSEVTTNGAWIAKNSWDTDWGNEGYFYISYEDASLLPNVTFSVLPADSYDNNYTYTGSSSGYYRYYYNCTSAYFANVYVAKGREQLTEVSFEAQSPQMKYSIQIYKDVTNQGNPQSGTPALKTPVTGTCTTEGIYTVPVTEAVYLDPNERYSIVVELFCPPNGDMAMGAEYSDDYTWYQSTAVTAPYQSFSRGSDDSMWTDANTYSCCYRINAHTKNSNAKKVTFKNSSGKIINTQYLQPGGSANVDFSKKTGYATSFSSSYTNITADKKITVKWTANTYKVSFNANKGKTSKKYINVKYDSKFGTLPTATRRYYKFAGWYTSAGRKITASTKNTYAQAITLKAKWTKVSVAKGGIKKLTTPKKQTIKLNIKKISGVNGYAIQYSTKKNMKGAKLINTTKTTKTIGKLKSGKKYYIRVRAFKKDSTGKRVYGNYSPVKSIKVK
ncbi:MAG: InlB B-repeat-containing protein [Lachnospiraceae bacterium]|nr:InlB B-repeat-containing protein [Lachnospiraceae bacterium]